MSIPRRLRVLRRWYGEGPLHLLLMVSSFALAGYAGVRLLDGDTLMILVWFVGAALVHDLLLVPLYSAADRALRVPFARRPRLVNHVRVPLLLSGLLLLMWFPLITRHTERYEPASGLSPDRFLGNWLLITAALFAVSALRLVVRTLLERRRARNGRPSASH
uniref:Lipoprotein n=1 Tax=Streptomyces sp. NBC_01401 TaxID=2903854 RepID=A0AAU3H351_9ACTN